MRNLKPRTKAIHPCIICPERHACSGHLQDRCILYLRNISPDTRQPLRSIFICDFLGSYRTREIQNENPAPLEPRFRALEVFQIPTKHNFYYAYPSFRSSPALYEILQKCKYDVQFRSLLSQIFTISK